MSAVLQRISVSWECVRCLSLIEDVQHVQCRGAHDLAEIKVVREHAGVKEREAGVQSAQENDDAHRLFLDHGEQLLKSLSLIHWDSFLEEYKRFHVI